MSPQFGIVLVLVALVSLGIGAFSTSRATATTMSTNDLALTVEASAEALLGSGVTPAAGTTWTTTSAEKTLVTLTVVSSSPSSLILNASANGVTAEGGARSK